LMLPITHVLQARSLNAVAGMLTRLRGHPIG
jgi:hypothetical protein